MTNDVVFSDLIQAFSSLRFFARVWWGVGVMVAGLG